MAFGRTQKPVALTTPADILAAAHAAIDSFRNDPELKPFADRHAAAQTAAARANTDKASREQQLRELAVHLGKPELHEDLVRFRAVVRQYEQEFEQTPRPKNPNDLRRRHAHERLSDARQHLQDAEIAAAGCSLEVADARLYKALPDLRNAYVTAKRAYDEASKAASDAAQALRDADFYLKRAASAAGERLAPRILELNALTVRRFDDALETARAENLLVRQVLGLFRAALGSLAPSILPEDTGWREFGAGDDLATAKLDTWRESLRTRAPHVTLRRRGDENVP